jgi:hypothetical protein
VTTTPPFASAHLPTPAWQARLRDVLIDRLAQVRAAWAADPAGCFYYPYVLWAEAVLHDFTGEACWQEQMEADLGTILAVMRRGEPAPGWVTRHFRFLAPVAEAVRRLQTAGRWSAADHAAMGELVGATLRERLTYMDYGAQNRALIYGTEFIHGARLWPDDTSAPVWTKVGEALIEDSLRGWAQEDASHYEPFWLCYTLEICDTLGCAADFLARFTTRFYFEHPRQMLMPDGLLPDWGDGDWTHSWAWNVANWTRAGSHYRDGRYLDCARRHFAANLPVGRPDDPEMLGGLALALRWLDPGVPMVDGTLTRSDDVVDDLVGKKYVARGDGGAYLLYSYRDEKACGYLTRDYLAKQLHAPEEKPHHGHADEQSVIAMAAGGCVLLADGGYRDDLSQGYRADYFHNRIVVRHGFGQATNPWDELRADNTYSRVSTEKLHGGNFGTLDYLRTRLRDEARGYTGDRLLLFVPATGLTIVVDSVHIDRAGPKQICNLWHPQQIVAHGPHHVISRVPGLWLRDTREAAPVPAGPGYWTNPPTHDLLIQFLDNRDKPTLRQSIRRRYAPADVFGQVLRNYFCAGQRLTFVTVLRPHRRGTFAPEWLDEVRVRPAADEAGRTLGLGFLAAGSRVEVGLKLDLNVGLTQLRGRPMFSAVTGLVDYGDGLRTDGDFAYVSAREDGTREMGGIHLGHLELAGERLFRMAPTRRMWQGPEGFSVADCRDRMPRWHEVVASGTAPLHA